MASIDGEWMRLLGAICESARSMDPYFTQESVDWAARSMNFAYMIQYSWRRHNMDQLVIFTNLKFATTLRDLPAMTLP